jgi:hypothetical protein
MASSGPHPQDFPYNFEDGVQHWLLWSTREIPAPRIQELMDSKFPEAAWDRLYFLNPPALQSVLAVRSFAVVGCMVCCVCVCVCARTRARVCMPALTRACVRTHVQTHQKEKERVDRERHRDRQTETGIGLCTVECTQSRRRMRARVYVYLCVFMCVRVCARARRRAHMRALYARVHTEYHRVRHLTRLGGFQTLCAAGVALPRAGAAEEPRGSAAVKHATTGTLGHLGRTLTARSKQHQPLSLHCNLRRCTCVGFRGVQQGRGAGTRVARMVCWRH